MSVEIEQSIARMRLPAGVGGLLPALTLIGLFFVVPVLALLLRSVTDPAPGLQNYAALLGDGTYARVFFNTFLVAFVVTIVTVLVAFPVAWMLAIMPPALASILFGIIILSMWTNLLTRTYAWMVLLQRTGVINRALIATGITDQPLPLINNLTGVTIGMVYIMLPFMILPVQAALERVPGNLVEASSDLGASPGQTFRNVLFPLALPGIVAGSIFTFSLTLGDYIIPQIIGTSRLFIGQAVYSQQGTAGNIPLAAAFTVVPIVIMGFYLWGAKRMGAFDAL
ncbi:MAG: ABC transporter permease [Mesorhizobium sp.]|nr:MAG: ABC transporter permease [Mesorhizobium sp.]